MDFFNKNKNTIIIIVAILFFFYFIVPSVNIPRLEKFDNVKDPNYKIDVMKCSANCCGYNQQLGIANKLSGDYVASNLHCSNGVQSGCPCLTKQQHNFLSSRGENAVVYDKEIPETYILKGTGKEEKSSDYAVEFQVEDGQLYPLPNHGAMYNGYNL